MANTQAHGKCAVSGLGFQFYAIMNTSNHAQYYSKLKTDKLNSIFHLFLLRIKWSFYPSLNGVKWLKWTEGHIGK